MVKVRICKSSVSLRVQVEGKGHAETAQAGKDLVCAAVSALLYGYAEEIKRIREKDLDERYVSVGETEGNAMIDVICKHERCYKRVLHNLAPIERSLEKICQTNPEALKVSYISED